MAGLIRGLVLTPHADRRFQGFGSRRILVNYARVEMREAAPALGVPEVPAGLSECRRRRSRILILRPHSSRRPGRVAVPSDPDALHRSPMGVEFGVGQEGNWEQELRLRIRGRLA